MEEQQATAAALGRHEADSREPEPVVRKRAWFYYALARLAVTRNLAVAAAIAVMCVSAVGLTLWAAEVKHRNAAAAAQVDPALEAIPPAQWPLSAFYKQEPDVPAADTAGSGTYYKLYYTAYFAYKCGHQGSFNPAQRSLDTAGALAYGFRHLDGDFSINRTYGEISDAELIRAIDYLTFDHGDSRINGRPFVVKPVSQVLAWRAIFEEQALDRKKQTL